MEYRGVEYIIVQDEGGSWRWSVSLGNPRKIRSGQAATKPAAIIKVWAVIDRAFGGLVRRRLEREQGRRKHA